MPSRVSAIPAASSAKAAEHFGAKLQLETDCWDVHESLKSGLADITEERLRAWPGDTLFVVYCAGPHCNGADRAAHKLAGMGRPVKMMMGGMTGWADEGFSFATAGEAAP